MMHSTSEYMAFTLFAALLLASLPQAKAQDSLCVASSDQLRTWTEDYAASALELEATCLQTVEALQQSLIGQHGPPLEIELKNAVCYGPCEGYMLDILYLSTITGCTCGELDTRFPLSDLEVYDVDSWCSRTPARFLKQIFDINIVWDEFNTFYCKCDPAVGVRCSSTRLERSFLLLILSLMLHILNS